MKNRNRIKKRLLELKEKGIVLTLQRLAVLEVLEKYKIHPTVEDIYHLVHKKYPTISKATIYNSLQLLKNFGLVQELSIEKDKTHYDSETDPHPHFYCRGCGKIFDLDFPSLDPIESMYKDLEGHGCRVDNFQIFLYGLCKDCASKEKESESQKEIEKGAG